MGVLEMSIFFNFNFAVITMHFESIEYIAC